MLETKKKMSVVVEEVFQILENNSNYEG